MTKNRQYRRTYQYEALMRYAKLLGFGDVHVKIDNKTGLHAMIAIHSDFRGPAIGGCRLFSYPAAGQAMKDVLRLAHMMTLKAAISGLSHGGGKSVIIKPDVIKDRTAFFSSFGDFVHEMNGRYIAAIDVGTSTADMDIIASRTPYVIGAATMHEGHGNPAIHTALGVFEGIRASVHYQLNRDDLKGLVVAVQGVGQVGYALCEMLHKAGATLIVCDNQAENCQRAQANLDARVIPVDEIYDVPCDIFAPCAMGGVLTLDHINRLQCKIICGSANNQLAHRKYALTIKHRNILFAPDFLVNSGGLINAAMVYDYGDETIATAQIMKIYDTCLQLFERADKEQHSTTYIAEKIAAEQLQ